MRTIYMLRGPVLVSAVGLSFLIPFVLQLSTNTQIHLAVAALGVLCFCCDVWTYAESQIKSAFKIYLDAFVLDDFLRAIYDPEYGLVAMFVGGFMGASTMYGLHLSAEQKTRLIQASLCINYDQANSLLMEPGGCKTFLPPAIQSWLQEKQQLKIEYNGDNEEASDASSEPYEENSPRVASSEEKYVAETPDAHTEEGETSPTSAKQKFSFQSQPMLENPTDPLSEMFSILRGLAFEQIKPYIQSIPDSLVESVGVSAIALLGLQIVGRRRRRSSFGSICSGLVLSGVATGAISAVVAKQMLLYNSEASLQRAFQAITARAWGKIKAKASRHSLKPTLAMIVLLVLGKRR